MPFEGGVLQGLHPPPRLPHSGKSGGLIYSPELGVFDVASVTFSLRCGLVISGGVFDVADVADADLEVNTAV
jgi:hypothetical protein